jgi:uncharacterized lipoprotein YmbA
MRRSVLALALVGLGCTSVAPTPTTHYFLRSDASELAGSATVQARVGLGRVAVAAYLELPGVAVETGANAIHSGEQHQWAEPLAEALPLFLREEIAGELGLEVALRVSGARDMPYLVNVFIEELHGTMLGEAHLVASYSVAGPVNEVGRFRYSQSAALGQRGYAGLVETEKQLLQGLAAAIAESLRGMGATED